MIKRKPISVRVDADFYDRIEAERMKFMKKNQLNKLTTRAFTRVLANNMIVGSNNAKKYKKRRK